VAVPDFQTLMRPLLEIVADGNEHPIHDVRTELAETFELTPDDLEEMLPSGRAKTFANRVGWAAAYLYQCGLLSRPRRAVYAITSRGRDVLEAHPDRVDLSVLREFPEFYEFARGRGRVHDPVTAPTGGEDVTPDERMQAANRELRAALAADLIDRVLAQSPAFFEQLVLDVLHRMGYGGERPDAVERLGQTGDEGVDGVIRDDTLGLEEIYVQAKRWARDRSVRRPDIQRFVGALQGQRAGKGVFITTSGFTPDAHEYAEHVVPRVVLVDGRELAQLMIDHGVGVSTVDRFEVKRVDSDYFESEAGTAGEL
jgi:restriction system protein